jgi:hypothetical protein
VTLGWGAETMFQALLPCCLNWRWVFRIRSEQGGFWLQAFAALSLMRWRNGPFPCSLFLQPRLTGHTGRAKKVSPASVPEVIWLAIKERSLGDGAKGVD